MKCPRDNSRDAFKLQLIPEGGIMYKVVGCPQSPRGFPLQSIRTQSQIDCIAHAETRPRTLFRSSPPKQRRLPGRTERSVSSATPPISCYEISPPDSTDPKSPGVDLIPASVPRAPASFPCHTDSRSGKLTDRFAYNRDNGAPPLRSRQGVVSNLTPNNFRW